jgi:hypothetical protein
MGDEHVEFAKATFVQEQFDTFPRSQLSTFVLCLDAFWSAALQSLLP